MQLSFSVRSLLAICLAATSLAHADDDAPKLRRHDAGPLTADDFQAAVPNPLPKIGRFQQYGWADTDVQIRTQYRYRTRGDEVVATLTEIEVFSVFLTQKSWLARATAAMLDHEQGHFDITQIHALQLNLHLNQQLADGKPPVGRGTDLPAAVKDLNERIQESLKPTLDRLKSAQLQYDSDTQNGTRSGEQAEQRQRQLALLKELVAE